MRQTKKLQLEQRDKNIQLLASLAPKSNTSMSLLSSATLGQNPLAPTSAQDRQDGREDLVVRRGIDRLRRLHGDGEGSGSEESEDEVTKGRKGKGKAREEIVDIDNVLTGDLANEPSNGGPGPSGKLRRKRTKQVSFEDQHRVRQELTN